MNLLLDTHAFIWWRDDPQKLSQTAFDAIADSANEVHLSVVSVWEIQIKADLRKLSLTGSLEDCVTEELTQNNFRLLSLKVDHIYGLGSLQPVHRDPFDRIIISQANVEGMAIVTVDPKFSAYPVTILW